MTVGATAYDAVVYPSTVFPSTHPDRLASIARLHGLDAPPIATARVLEIGGGDGINTIAMAAAYPDARFLSFDLSETAAARGARIVQATGVRNIQVGAGDVCDAAAHLDQQFDYIIVHGVYAWVPAPVREAIMVLIGRVLSPTGVAMVSYNALPGGHLRRVIRDMALHHVGHIADPTARMAAAKPLLAAFATPRAEDNEIMRALRDVARPIAEKHLAVLYHDELGEVFEPQSLSAVAAAAAAQGLGFLNDTNTLMMRTGFPGNDLSEDAVIAAAQAWDYETVLFFRSTLLVRAGRAPRRSPDLAGITSLWMASLAERRDGAHFVCNGEEFEIGDDALAEALARMGQVWPQRVRVADMIAGEDRLAALFQLYLKDIVTFHVAPLPGARAPGAWPQASALARHQVASGAKAVFTLDHRVIAFTDPAARAFVALLDGSRDRAALEAAWAESGYADQIVVGPALEQLANGALLIA